ncbi:MAG: peroxiredoxin, partial [Methylophilaceae bacterium]
MKARVKWVEDVCFMGESESGHAVILDGSPEIGGRNLGMRPMEMLLVSMGACS